MARIVVKSSNGRYVSGAHINANTTTRFLLSDYDRKGVTDNNGVCELQDGANRYHIKVNGRQVETVDSLRGTIYITLWPQGLEVMTSYRKSRFERDFFKIWSIFDSCDDICLTHCMNSTGLVGGIAILMIFAAGLGGPNGLSGVKASAFETSSARNEVPVLQNFWTTHEMGLSSDSQNELSRHVQIVIDGKVYSGTLFAEIGAR